MEVYDGLPTYSWDARSTESIDLFKYSATNQNRSLFWILQAVLAQKIQLNHLPGRSIGEERYLTQRVRRIIAGDDTKSVQEQRFAFPLMIPVALQACIEEMRYRYYEIAHSTLPSILIPVHDPSRQRPTTATLPLLQDSWDETGNLRYWVISNESMWSGQHRVLDEITEFLLILFSWFTRKQPAMPHGQPGYNTDHPHCLWYIADFLRRRLILPKAANAPQSGQVLSEREARLFRAWVCTRPPPYASQDWEVTHEGLDSIEAELNVEGNIEEELFWQDGDEGVWKNEEGVPSWRDSDDTFGLTGLSI